MKKNHRKFNVICCFLCLAVVMGMNSIVSAAYYTYDVGDTDGTWGHNYVSTGNPRSFNTADKYLTANTFTSTDNNMYWNPGTGYTVYKYEASDGYQITQLDLTIQWYLHTSTSGADNAKIFISTTWDGTGTPDFSDADWTNMGFSGASGTSTLSTQYPNGNVLYLAYWGKNIGTDSWMMQLQKDTVSLKVSAVPEPVTISLLGLGGIFCLVKRKTSI